MAMKFLMRSFLPLLIAFLGASVTGAQEDSLLNSALVETTSAAAYDFEFDFGVDVSGIPNMEIAMRFTGNGTLARETGETALDLSLDGRAEVAGTRTPLTGSMRIVDNAVYFTEPGSEIWSGIPLDELLPLVQDVLLTSFVQGFNNPDAAPSSDLVRGSLDDSQTHAAFQAFVTRVRSLDFSPYATVQRQADETINGVTMARYTTDVDVELLMASEQVVQLLGSLIAIADSSQSAALSPTEISALSPVLGQMFKDSTLALDQYVDLGSNHLSRIVLNLDAKVDPSALSSEAGAATIGVDFDMQMSRFNQNQVVAVPARALMMSGLANVLGVENLNEPAQAATSSPVAQLPTATPTPAQSAASSMPIEPNTPTVIELSAVGPTNLLYTTSGTETVNVVVRSLEEPGTLDTTLKVLGTNGVQLAENDDHTSARASLNAFDSVVEQLQLPGAGVYTVQVSSFSGAAEGRVEVTVESASRPVNQNAQPTPVVPVNTGGGNVTVNDIVPRNGSYTYLFTGAAGQVVTITVRATSSDLDPKVTLIAPNETIVAENDDHEDSDPSLTSFDSRIVGITLPQDGAYTVQITGFASTGGPFEMTIEGTGGASSTPVAPATPVNNQTGAQDEVFSDQIESGEGVAFSLPGSAGDVVTITAVSRSGDLDPQIYIYDSADNLVTSNDDHGTSDPRLSATDARVQNLILPATGEYSIEVFGYGDTAGRFDLTISRVASGAPTGPGTEEVTTGKVQAGDTFSYIISAQQGDYVTIVARALTTGFDPQLTLLGPGGVILADNDDHSSLDNSLSRYDSRITNFIIPATGEYTIEVNGYRDSAGNFAVTVTTLR